MMSSHIFASICVSSPEIVVYRIEADIWQWNTFVLCVVVVAGVACQLCLRQRKRRSRSCRRSDKLKLLFLCPGGGINGTSFITYFFDKNSKALSLVLLLAATTRTY